MHQKSAIDGEMCIDYIRALNLGFDDKTADEIPILWPAACRNRYLVLGSLGASGKSAGSIAVLFITNLRQTHAGFLISVFVAADFEGLFTGEQSKTKIKLLVVLSSVGK
jgi:hypothetical protein